MTRGGTLPRMTRLLLAATVAAAGLLGAPAAHACDLSTCVPAACRPIGCPQHICYQNEYQQWCLA